MDYKEKLIALLNDKDLSQEQKEKLEQIFPLEQIFSEESEDERIRKELIELIGCMNDADPRKERWIAWLEKQGEQKYTPKHKVGDTIYYKSFGKIETMIVSNVITDGTDNPMYEDKEGGAVFEKELIEQKPVDKVEPKFHEGEWVVCKELNTAKIINIVDDKYEVEFIEGDKGFPDIDYIDRNFHLWTIQDAKAGDVLVHNSIIFIFMGIENGIVKAICTELIDTILNFGEPEYDDDYCPVTKEQRDLLFSKMREAGYEWDAEKKELKKIEEKSVDKVEPKFKVGEWI